LVLTSGVDFFLLLLKKGGIGKEGLVCGHRAREDGSNSLVVPCPSAVSPNPLKE
jgi:hypothetical protein